MTSQSPMQFPDDNVDLVVMKAREYRGAERIVVENKTTINVWKAMVDIVESFNRHKRPGYALAAIALLVLSLVLVVGVGLARLWA